MGWNVTIRRYIHEHLTYYMFVSILFLMGVVFGSMLVNSLTLEQKQDLGYYLDQFFRQLGALESGVTLWESISVNMKWLLLIWMLGISVIGLPVILILDFLKGVLLGFSIGYLAGQLSWKGMLFALVSIAPQNVLIVPALLIASVAAISFSLFVLRNRFLQQRGNLQAQFSRYSVISLIMGLVLIAVSLYEAFVAPVLMNWTSPWLMGA